MSKKLIKQLFNNVVITAESIGYLIDFIEELHQVSNWGVTTPLDDAKCSIYLVKKDLEKIMER